MRRWLTHDSRPLALTRVGAYAPDGLSHRVLCGEWCAVRLTKKDVERLAEDDNEVVAKTAKVVLKNQFDSDSEESK